MSDPRHLLAAARPRPWSYAVNGDGVYINHDDYGVTFGHYRFNGQGEADAALIVRAVNEYEALLDVASAGREFFDWWHGPDDGGYDTRTLEAALIRLDEVRGG